MYVYNTGAKQPSHTLMNQVFWRLQETRQALLYLNNHFINQSINQFMHSTKPTSLRCKDALHFLMTHNIWILLKDFSCVFIFISPLTVYSYWTLTQPCVSGFDTWWLLREIKRRSKLLATLSLQLNICTLQWTIGSRSREQRWSCLTSCTHYLFHVLPSGHGPLELFLGSTTGKLLRPYLPKSLTLQSFFHKCDYICENVSCLHLWIY